MAFGKPDAGKPPVRFDEGRSETVIGLVPLQPVRSAYSTHTLSAAFGAKYAQQLPIQVESAPNLSSRLPRPIGRAANADELNP